MLHCKHQTDPESTKINRKIMNISGVGVVSPQIVPLPPSKFSSFCSLKVTIRYLVAVNRWKINFSLDLLISLIGPSHKSINGSSVRLLPYFHVCTQLLISMSSHVVKITLKFICIYACMHYKEERGSRFSVPPTQ